MISNTTYGSGVVKIHESQEVPTNRWNDNYKSIVGVNKYLSDAVEIIISGVSYYVWFQTPPIMNEDDGLVWVDKTVEKVISLVRIFDMDDGLNEWHNHYSEVTDKKLINSLVEKTSIDIQSLYSNGKI